MRFWLSVMLLLGGCLQDALTICPGDVACPPGYLCDVEGGCVRPEQRTSCEARADGDECSYPGVSNASCAAGTCRQVACGNGVRTFDEVCDDGNTVNGDGCAADCRSNETCGNGVVDVAQGEQCDDGNVSNMDACHDDCLFARCGDGILDPQLAEECDEGAANSNAPDTCRFNCTRPRCGDQVVDTVAGELCDDGNARSGDGCSADCLSDESCGNAVVDLIAGETCDDGNNVNGDGCSGTCQSRETCGNGIVDGVTGEVCDSFNQLTPTCDPDCSSPLCGDGIRNQAAGEECDDQNLTSGDGCDAHCRVEECGNGRIEDNEGCDDNNLDTSDACPACQPATCGDGFTRAGVEACDDGNQSNTDGCLNGCIAPSCGDGHIRAGLEECEDGNAVNTDSCVACRFARCGDGFVRTGIEQCDDGNQLTEGNGCGSTCSFTPTCVLSNDLSPVSPGPLACESLPTVRPDGATANLAFVAPDLVFTPLGLTLRVSPLGPMTMTATFEGTVGLMTFSESTCNSSPGTTFEFDGIAAIAAGTPYSIVLDGVSALDFPEYPAAIGEICFLP